MATLMRSVVATLTGGEESTGVVRKKEGEEKKRCGCYLE